MEAPFALWSISRSEVTTVLARLGRHRCHHRLVASAHLLFPQCSLILTSDMSSLSPNRLRSIQKHQTPVVGVDYISSCLEKGTLLPVDGYRLDASPAPVPTTKSHSVSCR